MNIKNIWINDPAKYVEKGEIKWSQKMTSNTIEVKARSVYDLDGHYNLLDLIDFLKSENRISQFEPFSNADTDGQISSCESGLFQVIGPSLEYYKSLVPDFRNDLIRKDGGYDSDESQNQIAHLIKETVYSKTLNEAEDDPSPHNKSSVIVLFQPSDGKKFLFMGDACRNSIDNIFPYLHNKIKNVYWLKVPHHGSKHNLNSNIINHLRPKVAFISTEKYGHYLSKAVVNAFNKLGTEVYTTNNNDSICYHQNTPSHSGYTEASPLK